VGKIINANGIVQQGEMQPRSILNYLLRFPVEHTFTFSSIIGLILLNHFTNFNTNLNEVVANSTIMEHIYPSLQLIILFMIFGDYSFHIHSKYIRRAFKFLLAIHAPFIIGYFFLGLLSPLLLIIRVLVEV